MLNDLNLAPRFKAALIHLGLSMCAACVVVAVVFGVWYAPPWAQSLGVSSIFLMILGVDLCLGPLLTAVVYKVGKSSLKFDLSVIVLLQLLALGYGLVTVAAARPAYLVFTVDRFDLVQAHEVYESGGTAEKPTLTALSPWLQPWWGAQTTAAEMPTRGALTSALAQTAMSGGPDVPNLKNQHREYATVIAVVQRTAVPLTQLKPAHQALNDQLRTIIGQYPAGSVALPIKVKFTVLTAILNPSTGALLGIEPIDLF